MKYLALVLSMAAMAAVGQTPKIIGVGIGPATNDYQSSSIAVPDGSRVIALSNEEYARLQKLRQAVVDAETEIAMRHGVDTKGDIDRCRAIRPGDVWGGGDNCLRTSDWTPRPADHFEFRGQYLLINVPKAVAISRD